jgi:hypothetical protein
MPTEITEISLKSAGAPGVNFLGDQVTRGQSYLSVRWSAFMLAHPRPVDQEQDAEAGLSALAESDERISYKDIRKTLGLE